MIKRNVFQFSIFFFVLFISTACSKSINRNTTEATTSGSVLNQDLTKLPKITSDAPTVNQPSEPPTLSVPELEIFAGRDFVSNDYLHILGEVRNNTNDWFNFVEIIATYYDDTGNVLGTDFTFLELEDLAPNDSGVFDLFSNVGGASQFVSTYKLQVQGNRSQSIPYREIEIKTGREYNEYGYYHITGEVTNKGQYDCEFTEIVGGLYNSDGKVIGVDFTFTDLDILIKGDTSPFDLSFSDQVEQYNSYKLWVDCSPIK